MKINLSCPVNNTGYGLASLNIIKELANISDLTYLPIGQPAVTSKEDYDLIFSLLSKKYSIDFDAPYIKIWHQFDLSEHIGKGKYYAYPFFELDTLAPYAFAILCERSDTSAFLTYGKTIGITSFPSIGNSIDTILN